MRAHLGRPSLCSLLIFTFVTFGTRQARVVISIHPRPLLFPYLPELVYRPIVPVKGLLAVRELDYADEDGFLPVE